MPTLEVAPALGGGRVGVSFALASGDAGTIELVDVAGRRVARTSVVGSGRAQQQWLGDSALPAGVDWVRLAHAGPALVRRTVVLR